MKLSFAAYDPAIRPPDGNYWVWQATAISKGLPDRIRSHLIQLDPCREPNSLAQDDLYGGCIALDNEWCVFYRHYNGGRDLRGRPERGILLIGFASRAEAMRQNCSKLLESNLFSEWAVQQPLAICPAPPNTACDGNFVSDQVPSSNLEQSNEFKGSLSATAAPARSEPAGGWNECQRLPATVGFHWRIKRVKGIWSSAVDLLSEIQFPATATNGAKSGPASTPNANAAAKSGGSMPDPAIRLQHLLFTTVTRLVMALTFFVGTFAGWTVRGWRGDETSKTPSIDIKAALHWAASYQHVKHGQEIPREELVDRLKANNWDETFRDHVRGSESKQPHKRPVNTD